MTTEKKSKAEDREQWIRSANSIMTSKFDKGIAAIHYNILMDQIDIAVKALQDIEDSEHALGCADGDDGEPCSCHVRTSKKAIERMKSPQFPV